MRRFRSGFTLIEVSLFLAITGLLFMGIAVGVQNSIYQQRYNDSVQSFADFLRNIYSEVTNVQSLGGGQSEKAIYGKLITFGEKTNLAGGSSDGRSAFVYDVIGNIGDGAGTGTAIDLLRELKANVVIKKDAAYEVVGVVEEYRTKWEAEIQKTDSNDPYKGTILVVRHPKSGTVYTYTSSTVIEVNDKLKNLDASIENLLVSKLTTTNFKAVQVDFCIAAAGEGVNSLRRDVRIVKNARNASGVEIVGSDNRAGGNLCAKN